VNHRVHPLAVGLLLLAVFSAPNTERADCATLADRARAAAGKVIEAIQTYQKCIVAAADGTAKGQDCDAEMQAVDTAHDDFVDAVDEAKPCR